MTDPTDVPVTLAEIARIAGVGRAAVSNWRRRHDSFPAPIGGTDTSPKFSLADVERWLHEQGKTDRIGSRERLWPHFESLGDRATVGLAIAEAGERVLAGHTHSAASTPTALPGGVSRVVEQAVEAAHREGGRETFEFLLSRWLDAHVRQVSATPVPLARLMADIAFIVRGSRPETVTVLDPACGTGGLLLAVADRRQASDENRILPDLFGVDIDPTLTGLALARLGFARAEGDGAASAGPTPVVDIRAGDSLRGDPHPHVRADIVLCNPPFNERDWGHEELATDPRWVFGLPPRTEPELAWVQHALARLVPGGVAVLLLPPAVGSRRAGRRVRSALLRTGALRGVIALPPGAAQPHSVSLHVWILRAHEVDDESGTGEHVFMMDAADPAAASHGAQTLDWDRLTNRVLDAVRGFSWAGSQRGVSERLPSGCIAQPVLDLLDDQVDLTPGRYVPESAAEVRRELRASWGRFDRHLDDLKEYARSLSRIDLSVDDESATTVTVGDLERARALDLRTGQTPPDELLHNDVLTPGAIPVLSVSDLILTGRPGGRLPEEEVESGILAGTLTVAIPGDVVVVGVERAFRVWVQTEGSLVIGSQLHALRADPQVLDTWFLAGCLRAPANARQAGSHTSSAARIEVRKLRVPQLPLAEQRTYGTAFRKLLALEETLHSAASTGNDIIRGFGDALAAGQLRAPRG